MAKEILERLIAGDHLSVDQARAVMGAVMDGKLEPAQIAALLIALRVKGETVDELTGLALAMRDHAVTISPRRIGLVDTCGTGGDGRNTFNISTATALVAASMGVPVAKHGNRAVSSRCGSADVLEALGVVVSLPPAAVTELIDEVGIGFLFAPGHHPAMRHAAPVRRQLGVRTAFNLLGPLTNPAGVRLQLVGVFAPHLTEPVAEVLGALGCERAFVVHGLDGTDEVSIAGPTRISEYRDGAVRTFELVPEEAGLERSSLDELAGGTPQDNAEMVRDILAGTGGPRADAVMLNAGFVAMLAGRAETAADGVQLARRALNDGAATELLERLAVASRELADGRTRATSGPRVAATGRAVRGR
jgi:anthranilate phosphoribosyltransferase